MTLFLCACTFPLRRYKTSSNPFKLFLLLITEVDLFFLIYCLLLWRRFTPDIPSYLSFRLSITSIESVLCIANHVNRQLSTAIKEHLFRIGKSSRAYLNSVKLLNEKPTKKNFRRSELSNVEQLHLHIVWFNACMEKQPCETKLALEETVCRLINGIDCGAFGANLIASTY